MSIDPDLYQTATLGLLALGVILQLAILGALSGIRKALANRPADTGGLAAGGQGAYNPAATSASPLQSAGAASFGGSAAATGATPAQTSTPAAGGATGTMAAAGTGAAAAPVATAGPSATAADPQDQPFERDGRWWFRRGNELLVYDEQAAQWVPAPAQGAGPAAAAPAGMTSTVAATPGADAGSFWKCPSCGAVNGSTSASCRMCFTPRP